MEDSEIQRKLLKETISAKKATEVAMNIEMGIQNQLKMSGTAIHQTTNEVTTTTISNIKKIMESISTFNEQFHQTYNMSQLWLWVVGCSRKELQKLWKKNVESLNNK